MKNYFLLAVAVLVATAIMTSCSNNDDEHSPAFPEGEGNVRLVISDYQMGNKERASTVDEPAVAGEYEIADKVYVFVYNENNQLEFANKLGVQFSNNVYTTTTFKLGNGKKTFYVFANEDQLFNINPVVGSPKSELLDHVLDPITFPNDNPVELATAGRFSLGTLWDGEEVDIDGTGTVGSPQPVDVKIGRTVAKVNLTSVNVVTDNTPPLKGSFSTTFHYALRSVPNQSYLVGRYSPSGGTNPTPPSADIKFISSVDTQSYEDPVGTKNPIFNNYTMPVGTATTNINTPYYVVENTTSKFPQGTGDLFYGNTTYISLRTTYTPAAGELLSGSDPTQQADLAAGQTTFWTGVYNGERGGFSSDPMNTAGVTEVTECEDGVMFYHFPIRDMSETDLEKQCAVVRNHSYQVSVLSIKNWGSGNETEDDDKKIEEDPDNESAVQVNVTVAPWYRINQGVNL